ncbi:cysteine desulfurase family protein [Bacillus sp. FJAT-45350]|uniref:cysteine desulfurase family protein n=1 Tax=Bacillus sp. FJAT-45350 TaxID=2011014 RepID=UPI000BB92AD8|nr:cysteine desulfurase family protein [Bacillus sp. FJAT-45350]
MIYFDNSATTKPYREVLDTFMTVSETFFGNPSSMHRLGIESERILTKSRELIASLLGVESKEVIFTSGGTEGNNIVIKGITSAHKNRGNHIITSTIEHPSVLESYKQLETIGYRVTYLSVDAEGLISLKELEEAICEDTVLVSCIHVNNETGVIQPIDEIGQLLHKYPKLYFHVDHVQGVTKVPLNLKKAKIDFATISGHKFHGMKGTGVLYVRHSLKLLPLFHGGVQELNIRAGTENVAGIAALAKALRLSFENGIEKIDKLQQLKAVMYNGLETIDGVKINSDFNTSAPHIINFSIEGVKPEVIIQALAEKDIFVSTKSACSSKLAEPSRVLMEMGLGEKRALSGIRVSFSFENEEKEIKEFINELEKIVPEFLKVMR